MKNIFFAFLFCFSVTLVAQEEDNLDEQYEFLECIEEFHSDIAIDSIGNILVTEHITIVSTLNEFRHGIFRQIPLFYEYKGKNILNNIKILEVTKDGEAVDFTVNLPELIYKDINLTNIYLYILSLDQKASSAMLDIKIGNGSENINGGINKYKITYSVDKAIRFFDNFDELYWNVTGNYWNFKILKASATIHLPKTSKTIQNYCYTGEMGSKESMCQFQTNDSLNTITFESRALNENEGFTIATAFTPHLIKRPNALFAWWDIYGGITLVAFFVFGISLYFIVQWYNNGRNKKKIIIPSFKIPADFSAAKIRYIYKQECDNKSLVATLVQLAVKKYLKIEKDEYCYKIIKTENSKTETISNEEQIVFKTLLKEKELEINYTTQETIADAKYSMHETLEKDFDLGLVYKDHTNKVGNAFGLCFISFLLMFSVYIFNIGGLLLLPLGAVFYLLISKMSIFLKGCFYLILYIVGIFAIFITIFLVIFSLSLPCKLLFFTLFLVMIIQSVIYSNIMEKATVAEETILTQIKGFKMYLETAESQLGMVYSPDKTPELYNKLLPYAIALDVEGKWAEKFTALFDQISYKADWMTGIDSVSVLSASFYKDMESTLNKNESVSSSTDSNEEG